MVVRTARMSVWFGQASEQGGVLRMNWGLSGDVMRSLGPTAAPAPSFRTFLTTTTTRNVSFLMSRCPEGAVEMLFSPGADQKQRLCQLFDPRKGLRNGNRRQKQRKMMLLKGNSRDGSVTFR